jgi:multisubunit Na+/H+ antiporter MnhB subunit
MGAMMTSSLWIFDIILALALVVLAARVLTTPDLFKAVIVFIALGLLMAVAWTRLEAPDIALTEAAIGAGLTGALFLKALGRLQASQRSGVPEPRNPESTGPQLHLLHRATLALLVLVVGIALGSIVWNLPHEATGLAARVEAALPQSGVANPVTAVLLNFRGYDTLLEIGVLVLAVAGVWSLAPLPRIEDSAAPGPVLLALVRVMVPLNILISAYLLWAGTKVPGGAFQAGAVLSAAGVLLLVSGITRPPQLRRWPERLLVVMGFGVFLAIAVAVMAAGGRFLEYPADWAESLIICIEILLTLSIAAIILVLFAGGPTEDQPTA